MKGFRYPLLAFLLIFMMPCQGQLQDKIFAVANPSPGVWHFISYDITNGQAEILYTLPYSSMSGSFSGTADVESEFFYLFTGSAYYTIDISGGIDVGITQLPVAAGTSFKHVKFDPCHQQFIGLMDSQLTRFDPATNTFQDIAPISVGPATGNVGFLDPRSRRYVLEIGGTSIHVYDIDTGEQLQTIELEVPGGVFRHIAYYCDQETIIGTTAMLNEEVKYVSAVYPDHSYGHISEEITSGFWKPLYGGSTIDQDRGSFYWSGAGGQLIGVNIASGEVILNAALGVGELTFIQHFTTCACKESSIDQAFNSEGLVYPNPFTDEVLIQNRSSFGPDAMFQLYSITGALVFSHFVNSEAINIDVASGTYIYTLTGPDGKLINRGKLIKQ